MSEIQRPLVSIVSPIYRVENFIEECLESLFNQTYDNIEFVFVNDKTPDHSMEILDRMVKKYNIVNIKIINHEKNLGLCGVRNTGIKAANGDYIMIVDSDDILPFDSVETLVNCALQNNADYVESDFAYYPGYVGDTCKREYDGNREKYIASFISMSMPPSIWGKLYRKDLFKDVDILFKIGRDNVEDAYSTPILVDRAKRIAYTNKVTYYYRIDNPHAYSAAKKIKWNKVDDMLYCVTQHENYFKSHNCSLINNAIKEKKYRIIITYCLRLEDKKERKRLIQFFPENESYIREKSLKDRFCWYLINHDFILAYRFMRKFLY